MICPSSLQWHWQAADGVHLSLVHKYLLITPKTNNRTDPVASKQNSLVSILKICKSLTHTTHLHTSTTPPYSYMMGTLTVTLAGDLIFTNQVVLTIFRHPGNKKICNS